MSSQLFLHPLCPLEKFPLGVLIHPNSDRGHSHHSPEGCLYPRPDSPCRGFSILAGLRIVGNAGWKGPWELF